MPCRTWVMALLITLSALNLSAATPWKVNGTVTDGSGDTLPGVVVKLSDAEGKTKAFCSTDGDGRFTLRFASTPGKGWKATFALLGFSTNTVSPDMMQEGMKVVLAEAPLELKEVIVKIPPIKSRGDTLTYDVASFRSKADRNIEDVIKKLPGVDVTREGRILYNGESINRFYIEGLDVVAGRYAIATRNISPDDIISVEVFENHQPVKVLKDIQTSDRAALNLKMKKKRMLKPVGNVRAGGGSDDRSELRWLGDAFGMFIAPTLQVLTTAKANNWGNPYGDETKSLTDGDNGGKSLASNLYSATPFGSAKIPSERYFDNRSATASVSAIAKTGENSKLNVTADYTDDRNRTANTESITYSNGDDPAIGFYEKVVSRPQSQTAKLSIKFENNTPTNYISEQLSLRGRFADNSYAITNSGDIAQRSRTDDYNFDNSFATTLRRGNNVISLSSHIAVTNTPVSRLQASDAGKPLISQRGSALSFTTREEATYKWLIGSHSQIGTSLKFESAYDTFKSDYASSTAVPAANDIRGHNVTVTAEPEYRYKPNTRFWATLRVPVSFTSRRYTDRLTATPYPTDRADIGVRATFNIRPTARLRGSLSLGRSNSFGGMDDYIVNPVYTTYRNRTTLGSGELNEREKYSAVTNLHFRDPIRAVFVSFTALYNIGHDNRIKGSDVTPGQVSTSVENSRNRSDMMNTGLTISKNVRSWRTTFTLDGSMTLLKRRMLRQKKPYTVENTAWSLHASVNSSPVADRIDFSAEVRYEPTVQKITALGVRNNVDDIAAQASLSVHPLKQVEVYSKVYWNKATIPGGDHKESLFVGAGIRYHSGHFEAELSGKNLTNTKTYSYSYFQDSDLYSYSFDLRPIEFLATVKYTF